jgi:hypothetical protein
MESGGRHFQIGCNLVQIALTGSEIHDAGSGVTGKQQLDGRPPGGEDFRGARVKDHAFGHWSVTGPYQPAGSFEFDDTNAAGPARYEITVMAERGDADPGLFRSLKNRHPWKRFDFSIVYLDF